MADEQLIKPRELPAAVDVFSDDAIMTDDGVTVSKATPVQIVNAGAPVPTQDEAVAGVDNTKRMTPLTTKQVLDNVSAPAVLRAQAWAESTTAPDPAMPGSKSSRTWALEAAQSAEDAEEAADTAATNTANAITSAMQGYVSAASGSASAAATSETNAATSAGQAAISAGQAVAAMAGSVRFDQAQSLTSGQKQQARENIAAVSYEAQTLTTGQGLLARANISAPLTPASSQGGDTRYGQIPDGSSLVLPSGGTWEYDICYVSQANGSWAAARTGGVAAGGTSVSGIEHIKMYRLWRIA